MPRRLAARLRTPPRRLATRPRTPPCRAAAALLEPHRALFAALVGAQVAYGKLPDHRRAPATRAIVGLMLATALAEARHARGGRGVGLVTGAGALGFAVELAGVATGRPFGHYAYGSGLGPRVGGVPLLAAAAWAMMARPSWAVAGRLARRPTARVPLAAGALTAWDVFLDPRMVREGFWTWPGGGRYEGIPASNFAGWWLTGAAIFTPWAALEPAAGTREQDGGAIALYAWTWAGETFANAVLWRRPRVAIAGALAMGAFAVPALRRYRR